MPRLFSHIICRYLLIAVSGIFSSGIFAQSGKKELHEGDKLYEGKKYNLAEKKYTQALDNSNNSTIAAYNLGNAYYQQNKFVESAEQFQSLTHKPLSKDTLAKVYHNLGNALLKQKKYADAVDAYKQALKNNSTDNDTRYNLAYAQQMLKKEQQQNKDKQKEKEDENKKEDKKNKKNKKDENKKQDQKKDDKEKKQPQPQQSNLSKEDAQRLLDALLNDEKKLQDNKKIKKIKGEKITIEKDW